MLSLFPDILFLAPFSALIIRIALAVTFAIAAWRHVSQPETWLRVISIAEVAAAAALFVGSMTQAVALGGAAIAILWLSFKPARAMPVSTIILVLVMCLSLLVTGAGALAFDLPL